MACRAKIFKRPLRVADSEAGHALFQQQRSASWVWPPPVQLDVYVDERFSGFTFRGQLENEIDRAVRELGSLVLGEGIGGRCRERCDSRKRNVTLAPTECRRCLVRK
jgi:hypothetical protein